MSFGRPNEDIRYVLTDKGRLDLQLAMIEEELTRCEHSWEIVRRGLLACVKCGSEHRPRRPGGSAAAFKR